MAEPRNRIDRVTTKSGDSGRTSLADGRRYDKADARIELIGTLDELNCAVGMIRCVTRPKIKVDLIAVQSRLFDLGAAVATGRAQSYWSQVTAELSERTSELNEELQPLREFVLPGGGDDATATHFARAVARRCEREFWRADIQPLIDADLGQYLNRLSDFLFVVARVLSTEEVLWKPLPDNANST